jgi:hypothetical protein
MKKATDHEKMVYFADGVYWSAVGLANNMENSIKNLQKDLKNLKTYIDKEIIKIKEKNVNGK